MGYNKTDSGFEFAENIEINGWTVNKIVNHYFPDSNYRYDPRKYLEFIIKDNVGKSRKMRYYYNGGNNSSVGVKPHPVDTIKAIVFFIEETPILKSENWEEFDAFKKIASIKTILKKDCSMQEQLNEIKAIIQTNNKIY